MAIRSSEYTKSTLTSETPTLIQQSDSNSTDTNFSKDHSAEILQTSAEDSSDAAAGRHSQELHGSCMAVVIGLVAGIMWF